MYEFLYLCRLKSYDYSTNAIGESGDHGYIEAGIPRCTVEYVLGQEVSRSYTALSDMNTNGIVDWELRQRTWAQGAVTSYADDEFGRLSQGGQRGAELRLRPGVEKWAVV